MINDGCGRSQPTVVGAIPRLVFLATVRKQAEDSVRVTELTILLVCHAAAGMKETCSSPLRLATHSRQARGLVPIPCCLLHWVCKLGQCWGVHHGCEVEGELVN